MSMRAVAAIISNAANLKGPTNLAANGVNVDDIDLTWTVNANGADGHEVYRQETGPITEPVESGTLIATVGPTTEFYGDTGLDPGTEYEYQVVAVRGSLTSDPSNIAVASTDQSVTEPTNFTAVGTDVDRISLDWSAPDNGDPDEYEWRRSDDGGFTWTPWISTGIFTSDNDTGGSDGDGTGLSVDTTYDYEVRAHSTGGGPGPAASTTGTTENLNTSSLSATQGTNPESEIDLSWNNAATLFGGEAIEVERSTTSGSGFSEIEESPFGVVESATDANLSSGTQYFFRVRATATTPRGTYTGPYSNEASATTDSLVPTAPSGLSVDSDTDTTIDVSWTDNSDDEDGFYVYYRLDGETDWDHSGNPNVDRDSVAANTTSHTITGLSQETTYDIKVTAHNANGESGDSNVVTETTDSTVPSAPTNLTVDDISDQTLDISWTDNASVEDGQYVYYRESDKITWDPADTGVFRDTVSANQESYSIIGLTNGQEYDVKVTAFNGATESADSNVVTATPTDANPVISGEIAEERLGYEARCRFDVNLDTESVKIEVQEYVGGFGQGFQLHENLDVTPGQDNVTSSDFVSEQCAEVEFRITGYSSDGQGGASGASVTTNKAVMDDFGQDTCT